MSKNKPPYELNTDPGFMEIGAWYKYQAHLAEVNADYYRDIAKQRIADYEAYVNKQRQFDCLPGPGGFGLRVRTDQGSRPPEQR